MRKLLFLVNPNAGHRRVNKSMVEIIGIFNEAGYEVTVFLTTGPGSGARIVEKRAADYDLIVCAGGDGTLNETITGLLQSGVDRPIGYIPCGSTNDLAATLGIVGTPSRICDDILAGSDVHIDAGCFNDRYFSYAASFGAFTAISYETPQGLKNALGHFAYLLNGAKELINMPRVKLRVSTADYEEEGTFFYGGVTNTTSIGGLYTLPEDEIFLDDGQFELLMIREAKHPQEYSETLLNLAVRNFDDPNILYLHGSEFVFESEEPVSFTLDGEFGGSGRKNVIKVLKKAITVNGSL